MSRLKKIESLKELKMYGELVRDGIIPISVNSNFEIYNFFKTRMVVNKEFNNAKSRSYIETCDSFNICEMTVRRAVTFMEG